MYHTLRRWGPQLLRYLLGAAILAWMVTTVDWSRTAALIARLDAHTVIGVLALSAANVLPWVLMWYVILPDRSGVKLLDLLWVDLVVKFINGILPSRLAGRAAAPAVLRRFARVEWIDAIAVSGVHTALYAMFYGLVCSVGIWVLRNRVEWGLLVLLALATAGYLVVGLLILLGGLRADRLAPVLEVIGGVTDKVPIVGDWFGRGIPLVGAALGDSADGFRETLGGRPVLAYFGAWSVAVVIFPGLRFWLLLDALTVDPVLLLFVPLYLVTAYSVTVIPLTPGGVGVTEATAAVVFVALGFPEAAVVPAVFLDRLFGVYLPSIAGWYPASTTDVSWG